MYDTNQKNFNKIMDGYKEYALDYFSKYAITQNQRHFDEQNAKYYDDDSDDLLADIEVLLEMDKKQIQEVIRVINDGFILAKSRMTCQSAMEYKSKS